eukprot:Amastigsp_a150_24.p5 type:complete len:109 gc:universal Amastigsp_a150_24:482-156(-)
MHEIEYVSRRSRAIVSKSSSKARGVMPRRTGSSRTPVIVCVLPEPVCPYAKIETLNPSRADWISGAVSAKTISCVASSPKMCVSCTSRSFLPSFTEIVASSSTRTARA